MGVTTSTLLLFAIVDSVRSERDGAAADASYRDPFDNDLDDGVTLVKPHKPPESLLDFVEYLAPVLKYYVVLLGLFAVARYFNRMLEAEDSLKEREQLKKRPNLRHDLMEPSDDESGEEESDSEGAAQSAAAAAPAKKPGVASKAAMEEDDDEVHEELITDGAKLVKMSESELTERRKKKKQSHPLFEGLQKIEEELKQKQRDDDAPDVSWNELHQTMLKRYQQKYPAHGLRVQTNDDYDDEFKELLKKHNIDPDEIRREVSKDKAA